jgi:hypothetical protein
MVSPAPQGRQGAATGADGRERVRSAAMAHADYRQILARFRVDPRVARNGEIARLRALGVQLVELAEGPSRVLFERFVREFIDPERGERMVEATATRSPADVAFDFGQWVRPDCVRRPKDRGCLAWLMHHGRHSQCVRFDRRPRLPAVKIAAATMDDAWAASWPGLFVNFDAGRAIAISIDYEEIRCDLRITTATPYR